ncbi:hypothetical protein HZS_5530 [Henneguya salminicola]|nr:hypothetical protein HZS_5530 [Henneguya salminicola]
MEEIKDLAFIEEKIYYDAYIKTYIDEIPKNFEKGFNDGLNKGTANGQAVIYNITYKKKIGKIVSLSLNAIKELHKIDSRLHNKCVIIVRLSP